MLVGIIIGIIVLVVIGFILAVPVSFLIVGGQSWAKKEANKMLEAKVPNRNFKRVMKILATTQNDLEAQDLWHRLKELEK